MSRADRVASSRSVLLTVPMTTTQTAPPRAEPQPLPENFVSVQPGGGVCYRIELAWGRWRRWWLKQFRPGYVRRMAALRRGDPAGAPHEILDPRDLKYCRNRCSLLLGPGRRPVPLARPAAVCPLGTGRAATDGLAAAGADGPVGLMPYWYLAARAGACCCA